MKAITIKQPWASLIAFGEKQFETRSWKTKHRGELAIHAGKSIDKKAYEAFSEVLAKHGINSISDLPTGCIIASVNLIDCHQVIEEESGIRAIMDSSIIIDGQEYQMGYYTEGYFGWKVELIEKFKTPIEHKGQLNLWDWKPAT